ncbi:carboxypeptidase-like regulatory domain-containing protein [Myroides sp. 1354]|uniref:carboxypeptidase-like regulatory domain-containing protein n=1 Tax=unclassified Myroides TaxID=2642485 RepID=UPI002574C026|nr:MULTISPECIES: carboxypeptidase-like regulatory domain-containing protein [unclassified Myroides]MDM1045933.1 carboxypeptidase-like regulatory domain-containing protein [Myroides sp. R163-1]MDM1056943.1 carboxypeptidase-like regulatory domain-containing protein [Myroides sp. 1354]MDM1070138.1 carboxypeptidase-like regulatory domain-containing protein [Myroides sp. 1372]
MRKVLLYCFVLLCSLQVLAGTRVIKGVVLAKGDGLPLPGASVLEKGTKNGVSTDLDGKFQIDIQDTSDSYLEVSFVGMVTEMVKINRQTDFYTILLKEDENQLDEIMVVTGYEATTKRNYTGSVVRIEDHLRVNDIADVSRMIEGRAAGVTVGSINKDYDDDDNDEVQDVVGSKETWKKSSLRDNAMRLEIGDNEFLALEDAQVALQIEGNRIRVLIDAYFFNDKQSGLEGTFKLKLPVDASPYYFAFGETTLFDQDKKGKKASPMTQFHNYTQDNFDLSMVGIQQRKDQQAIKQAKITEKETAADAYFSTIKRKVDPALMEWSGADMFSCRVFPLQANKLHHIVIGYDVDMVEGMDYRTFMLNLPEVKHKLRVDLAVADGKDYVITPMKDAVVQKANKKQYITYFNPTEKEINIRFNTIEPLVLFQQGEAPYFAGTMRVQLPRELDENMAKDAVFMLDTSLSANPVLFGVWVNLVEEILRQNEGIIDRFAVVNFSIGTHWYQEKWINNTAKNREALSKYMNNLALEGATDLGRALKEASHPTWLSQPTRKNIFLLSDGDLNWGVTHRELLVNYLQKGDRIYTYKTGLSGTNTELLDYLSAVTNGSSFTANSEAQLIESAKALRYKTWKLESIFGATATDILLAGGVTQLYDGQIVQLAARGTLDQPIQLKITGGSDVKVIEFNPRYKVSSNLASRIYGKIALTQLEQLGNDLKSASVDYSIYYSVLSNYTSFLMLESEREYEDYKVKNWEVAEKFVKEFTVKELLEGFKQSEPITAKKLVEHWITLLKKRGLLESGDEVFDNFVREMTEQDFVIQPQSVFSLWNKQEQTKEELKVLEQEEVTFDLLQLVAEQRGKKKSQADALKLLSSIIERNGSDVDVLRDLLTKTMQMNYGYDSYYLGQKILDTRIYDGLVYFNMARALEKSNPKLAAIFYYFCQVIDFDDTNDYGSLKEISALFASSFLDQWSKTRTSASVKEKMFLKRLREEVQEEYESYFNEQVNPDLVVLVYWNLDSTDLDLHILEASNEECYYGNRKTKLGGMLSDDVTNGFGPEMYVLPKAKAGKYQISIDYFSESGMRTKSAAKAYVEIYKYFGTSKQEVSRKTVVLKERENEEIVETVVFR